MRAEIANNRGDRIYVSDDATFNRYIADGWSVIEIINEGKDNGKTNDTSEKRANEARQKRRR